MFRVLALSSAVLLATPVVAAPGQTAQSQAAQPAANAKDKKVCRADQTSTGSIMPKKICHTQAEWDAIGGNTTALDQMRDWQRNDQMVQGSR